MLFWIKSQLEPTSYEILPDSQEHVTMDCVTLVKKL
jgi:hypothetical protein